MYNYNISGGFSTHTHTRTHAHAHPHTTAPFTALPDTVTVLRSMMTDEQLLRRALEAVRGGERGRGRGREDAEGMRKIRAAQGQCRVHTQCIRFSLRL